MLREISPFQLDYHSSLIQSSVTCFSLVTYVPVTLAASSADLWSQLGKTTMLYLGSASRGQSLKSSPRQKDERLICMQSTSRMLAQSKWAMYAGFYHEIFIHGCEILYVYM